MKPKPSLADFTEAALGVIQWAKDHGADKVAMNAMLKMGRTALKNPIPSKVFVLTFDNDEGLSSSVHTIRAGADAALFAYVEENWVGTMPLGTAFPPVEADAIDAYFNRDDNDDRAEIEEVEVEGQS